ncbi:hypothetical protein L6452_17495 [Arctium lappa]|uniref:Uncharacterized protein n=1 Tax=Arctium lappa TaxID=4217 RepID=A0ACB9C3F0_ARCLA|nr:hypothetical protein L6452_17495 [Arctium lappa]
MTLPSPVTLISDSHLRPHPHYLAAINDNHRRPSSPTPFHLRLLIHPHETCKVSEGWLPSSIVDDFPFCPKFQQPFCSTSIHMHAFHRNTWNTCYGVKIVVGDDGRNLSEYNPTRLRGKPLTRRGFYTSDWRGFRAKSRRYGR